MDALKEQVGGSHYMNLKMQPIELITRMELSFIQGNIVKYITRYMHKNGLEDLKKCIHYAKLGMQFEEVKQKELRLLNIAYQYIRVNEMSKQQGNVIVCTVNKEYMKLIRIVQQIAKEEYLEDIEGL